MKIINNLILAVVVALASTTVLAEESLCSLLSESAKDKMIDRQAGIPLKLVEAKNVVVYQMLRETLNIHDPKYEEKLITARKLEAADERFIKEAYEEDIEVSNEDKEAAIEYYKEFVFNFCNSVYN